MVDLREKFKQVVGEAPASKCLQKDEVYHICGFGAYCGPPDGYEAQMPPGIHAYASGHSVAFPSDEGMMLPERLFDRGPISLPMEWRVKLGNRSTAVIPVANPPAGKQRGLWLVSGTIHGAWTLEDIVPFEEDSPFMGVKMRPLYLQDQLYDAAREVKDLQMVVIKIGSAVMFVYKEDTSMLYLLGLGMSDQDCIITITDKDGRVYRPDGWTTDKNGDSYWKRLTEKKRRSTMKGLGNPVATKAPAATVETQAPAPAEPVKESDPIPVEHAPSPAPAAEAPAPAAVPAEAAVEGSDAKPSRRRMVRESKAVGLDLTKVIEDVSAPVEDITPDQLDKVEIEARQLRDLATACNRRAANLHQATIKLARPAIEKLAAFQALLK